MKSFAFQQVGRSEAKEVAVEEEIDSQAGLHIAKIAGSPGKHLHLENAMKRTFSSLLALVICGLALAAHDEEVLSIAFEAAWWHAFRNELERKAFRPPRSRLYLR